MQRNGIIMRIFNKSNAYLIRSNEDDTPSSLIKFRGNTQSAIVDRSSFSEEEGGINKTYIDSSPAVKYVNSLLEQAVRERVSDIHFEPFREEVSIRFRIDGVMIKKHQISSVLYGSISTRVKVMARMDIAEKRTPQDGSLQFKTQDRIYDFRVSTLPTVHGEKIVLRILYKNQVMNSLQSLKAVIEEDMNLTSMLKHSHGIILITGPTGSGKSTTLYTLLNRLNHEEKNIVTIEDPIEYELPGINQVSVNLKSGVSFESGLRSILRQDPDIIMVGEIRDEVTAEISVRAAVTGHLVLSTLHTNDAASSVNRLMDMGVPKYLLSDSLIGVMAQRLVRLLCCSCKKSYSPGEKELKEFSRLKLKAVEEIYCKVGCETCGYTGYSGRTLAYETLCMDQNLRRLVLCQSDADSLRQYCINSGMKTLQQYALKLVRDGLTSFEEYEKVAYSMGER